MCYKVELQKKNEIKLKEKMDKINLPGYMRKYFLISIESKTGALTYLTTIADMLNWFISEKFLDREKIADIELSDFNNIMAEDITLYLKTKEQNGMSPTTLETRKNTIRSFWNYLSRMKGTEINPNFFKDVTYKGISSNNNLVKKLPTEKQLEDMEKKILWKKDECVRKRNIAIFKLLKGTGLRESEVAGLDLSDIYLDEDMPYISILKKGKYRPQEKTTVYLTGSATKALKEWLDYRTTLDNVMEPEALFVNKNGTRTTESNIRKLFKVYGQGMTPHMLRHYYASIMASEGNIVFAQQQLGHTNISTTINNYANGAVGMKEKLENM